MHDLLWMLAFSFALVSYAAVRYFIPSRREQEIRDRKWLIELLIRRESLPDVTDAANMEALETIYKWTFVEKKRSW
jgi:hypothetical protein